jgi:hypothetical protein
MSPMWAVVLAGTLAVVARIRESGRAMNTYGARAMRHWHQHLPNAYRELKDAEAYFTLAGEEMQAQISDLIPKLAGPDLPGEDYPDKVARLNRARASAEELVLANSEFFPPPEPTRQEWEQTSPQEDALIDWAWRMQAQLEGLAETSLDFDQAAAEWMLPREYLEQMATASSPWEFWKANPSMWEASVQARWERHLTEDATDR